MFSEGSRKGFPRFFFPFSLARSILGNRRFMTLPISSLVNEIKFAGNRRVAKSEMKRFVCAGDLERHLVAVSDSAVAVEIAELLGADLDYRPTAVYEARLAQLEQGHPQKFHARHFLNTTDVDEYFEYQVRLIRSITAHGILSRHDMSDHHRKSVPEFSSNRPAEHEIGCAIGPEGETWMFRTGHHRLHIARQLGIERIPVEVHFVHWRWIARHFTKYRRMPFPVPATSDQL